MEPIDFTNFATDLMSTFESVGGNVTIINAVMDAVASLNNDFRVETFREKGVLVSAEFLDAWRAASNTFEGQKTMDVKSRRADFTEGDIDIEITLDDIRKYYNSYLGWLKTPGLTLRQAEEKQFELFFIQQIIANHFRFFRLKGVWKGVYSAAAGAIGANNVVDGLIKRMTVGRGVGGDIAASHVFDGDTITDANAYDQVNGVAQLISTVRPELLDIPLNCYLAQTTYDKFRKKRRAMFPNFVAPDAMPTKLDDFSNITLVIDPGLAGKGTVVVTPRENLVFTANEAPGNYRFKAVDAVKSVQINIRASLGMNYASPDLLFLNDLV